MPEGLVVRETRSKRYVLPNGENKPIPFVNRGFKAVPSAKLDDVHKLRLHRVVGNRIQTINLTKKTMPPIKMPELRQLTEVKTEGEHYGNKNYYLNKISSSY